MTVVPFSSPERAPPIEAILDLLERLHDLNARMAAFEAMNDLSELVARVEQLETHVERLETKQRRPFPLSLHVNEVTHTRRTTTAPSPLLTNINDQLMDLRFRIAQTERGVASLREREALPGSQRHLDFNQRLNDERASRIENDNRLEKAITAFDKRVSLAAKVFTHFNHRLTALVHDRDNGA
jgi:hypothetical protein